MTEETELKVHDTVRRILSKMEEELIFQCNGDLDMLELMMAELALQMAEKSVLMRRQKVMMKEILKDVGL